MQAVGVAHVNDRINDSLAGALAPAEYIYYFAIFYTVLGPPLGLILGGVGSGFLLVPVLVICVVALGLSVMTVLQTIWIPITCGASYLFIQLALHDESLYHPYIYVFGPWIFSLVIVQTLAMHRPNFLHRFAWFTLLMGLAVLPFMQRLGVDRVGLESNVGYANPNALGAWFGFCVLYLTIKGYLETRPVHRLATWLSAIGCLYIVTLTVSRGALSAVAISLLVASRRLVKVEFLPIVLLAGLLFGLVELGVFDQAINSYTARGAQETGRLLVWPLLIEKFLDSPFVGIGASHAGAFTSTGKFVTPHNGFLLLAVASGFLPLSLFCAYCLRSGMAALHSSASDRDAMLYLPLVVYVVLIASAGNLEFMVPWAVVSMALPNARGVLD
jgi:hypothetical protein